MAMVIIETATLTHQPSPCLVTLYVQTCDRRLMLRVLLYCTAAVKSLLTVMALLQQKP